MGQGAIFQFLKENEGQIFTSKEINMALYTTNAGNPLAKLRKYPPKGFNSSREVQLYDIKKGSKRNYIYWYKK